MRLLDMVANEWIRVGSKRIKERSARSILIGEVIIDRRHLYSLPCPMMLNR